jgi:anti-sigma factor RsiW
MAMSTPQSVTSGTGRLPTQEDIEQLLPWFVTGKLDDSDRQLVEGYLKDHPAMRAQLDLIESEQGEVVLNNEAVGTPSADALGKLMARIATDATRAAPWSAVLNLVQRGLDWLGDRSALVPVAAVAALALMLQAGTIGALLWHGTGPQTKGFQTASAPATAVAADKATYVLAGFVPAATAQQIEQTLSPLGVTIVDGPKAGGLYRLRLSDKPLGDAERDMVMTALKANSGVVRFVAPATP